MKDDKMGNTLALGRVPVTLDFVVCTLFPFKKNDVSCMPRVELAKKESKKQSKPDVRFVRPYWCYLRVCMTG